MKRQQSQPEPWCPACGSEVIWEGPPEHCLECGNLELARGARPEDDGEPLSGPELIRRHRRFVDAVNELYRLQAAKAAGQG